MSDFIHYDYTFNNPALLQNALTHSSYANENRDKGIRNNERLEFLGDSVLGLICARYIYSEYRALPEGELTKLRAAIVCESSLYEFAMQIGLGERLLLGRGERVGGGSKRPSVLADAVEAVLAAIYLDAGEYAMDIIDGFLLPLVEKDLSELISKGIDGDYKTPLQQLVQQTEGDVLEYVLISSNGPDHQKTFEVEVRVNSNPCGRGVGTSKRKAEQAAAKAALKVFGIC